MSFCSTAYLPRDVSHWNVLFLLHIHHVRKPPCRPNPAWLPRFLGSVPSSTSLYTRSADPSDSLFGLFLFSVPSDSPVPRIDPGPLRLVMTVMTVFPSFRWPPFTSGFPFMSVLRGSPRVDFFFFNLSRVDAQCYICFRCTPW